MGEGASLDHTTVTDQMFMTHHSYSLCHGDLLNKCLSSGFKRENESDS